ncbi:hypothetical protein C1Y26_26225, partial [Pseudomonas sp. MPR-R2A7]
CIRHSVAAGFGAASQPNAGQARSPQGDLSGAEKLRRYPCSSGASRIVAPPLPHFERCKVLRFSWV